MPTTSKTLQAMMDAKRETTFTVPVTVTPRETAVLIATSQGFTQATMAETFSVARPTIITTCATVYGKLSVPKAAAAVKRAIRVGLLTEADDDATRADLLALWQAGDSWEAIGSAPTPKAATDAPRADSSKAKPNARRSSRATTRKATGTEADKLAADKVAAQAAARKRG